MLLTKIQSDWFDVTITAEKKLIFFGLKKLQLPIPRSPERTSKLHKKDVQITEEAVSSQKRCRALQNIKFLNFFYFCDLWVLFDLLELDPDSENGSGTGSTDLIESRSETLKIILRKPVIVVFTYTGCKCEARPGMWPIYVCPLNC